MKLWPGRFAHRGSCTPTSRDIPGNSEKNKLMQWPSDSYMVTHNTLKCENWVAFFGIAFFFLSFVLRHCSWAHYPGSRLPPLNSQYPVRLRVHLIWTDRNGNKRKKRVGVSESSPAVSRVAFRRNRTGSSQKRTPPILLRFILTGDCQDFLFLLNVGHTFFWAETSLTLSSQAVLL